MKIKDLKKVVSENINDIINTSEVLLPYKNDITTFLSNIKKYNSFALIGELIKPENEIEQMITNLNNKDGLLLFNHLRLLLESNLMFDNNKELIDNYINNWLENILQISNEDENLQLLINKTNIGKVKNNKKYRFILLLHII